MSHILDLHEEAMDLADEALRAQRQGRSEQALHFGRLAFERERAAAELVQDDIAAEPTRSVLLRSAATLALDCGEIDEAKRLVAVGLAGTPPLEIRLELQELAEQLDSIPPASAPVYPSISQSTIVAAPSSQELEDFVRQVIGQVMHVSDTQSLQPEQALANLGLDSLMAVELRQRLEQGLEPPRKLPTTLTFDYPTIAALVNYLAQLPHDDQMTPATPPSEPASHTGAEETAAVSDEEINDLLKRK